MKTEQSGSHASVLAIDPGVRGFGFTFFEAPNELIDWGVRTIRFSVNRNSLKKVDALLSDLAPDIVVVEIGAHSRRSARVIALLRDIVTLCKERNIQCERYSKKEVRAAFGTFGVTTKVDITRKLIEYLPELARHKPPRRKPWETEDPRYSIFDAAALAFTFYSAHYQ